MGRDGAGLRRSDRLPVAVARDRPPVRPIIGAAFLVVAVLTVLPPASTDSIWYAAGGRTAVIGHSPYVMTPLQLERTGDPVGRQIPFGEIPSSWTNAVSVYGPVAMQPSGARPSLAGRRWPASRSG